MSKSDEISKSFWLGREKETNGLFFRRLWFWMADLKENGAVSAEDGSERNVYNVRNIRR